MKVTYLGQACTLVEAAGVRLLTDPWLTEGAYQGTWFHTNLLEDAGVTPASVLKDVDYVFISHEHEDHLDAESLRHLDRDTPVLICSFPTKKYRDHLQSLGLRRVIEMPPGEKQQLTPDFAVTIYGTAEYTNDAAILVEAEGCRIFNETDCKLGYEDLVRIGQQGVDLGFFMFSGANWYPMLYDYPEAEMAAHVQQRRRALLRGFAQRTALTRAKLAVPAAGPCTVLDPDLFWLNSERLGIFIDPRVAVDYLAQVKTPAQGLHMAATDVWTSDAGFQRRAPDAFHGDRHQYLHDAADRLRDEILARRAAERPADSDLGTRLMQFFEDHVSAQSPEVRARIGAVLALDVSGPHGGRWTVDFTAHAAPFVREGIDPRWTYRIEVEDKLIYPFVTGEIPFFEDLLLSLRVRLARRPDTYNEPLYHFLYEPDPQKLDTWYRQH